MRQPCLDFDWLLNSFYDRHDRLTLSLPFILYIFPSSSLYVLDVRGPRHFNVLFSVHLKRWFFKIICNASLKRAIMLYLPFLMSHSNNDANCQLYFSKRISNTYILFLCLLWEEHMFPLNDKTSIEHSGRYFRGKIYLQVHTYYVVHYLLYCY